MIRAMRTAASGMLAQQTQVDTLANNIANVNTTGFKSNRVNFRSLLYTTLREPGSATGADQMNPTGLQIGSGAEVSSSIKQFVQGELELTGNPLDVAVQGEGFFQIDMGNGEYRYTRDGSFRQDATGALVTVASLGLWGVSFDTFQIALGLSAATLVVLRFTSRLREMDGGDASGAPISLPQTVWASRWFLMRAVGVWMLFDTPMVLLKLLTTPETVAFYAAALRPVGFITMPFVVLGSVFTPSLSHDRAVSHEQLTANVKRLNFLALLMAPAGYLVCTLGGKVLLLAFGSKYLNSESILGVLALAFIVYFASPSAVPLVVAGRERALVFVSMVSAALLAGLCVWLIPSHGALGAAYACLATFSAAKLAHMVMYWPVRLSVGDWRHLGTAGYMVLWLLLMTRLSGTAQVTVLVAGGVAAGLVLLRQMLRTHMFS